MRTFARWLAGLVGVAALARLLSRRKGGAAAPEAPLEPDPADELRRKLAAVRASSPDAPAGPPAAPTGSTADAVPAAEPPPSIDERRAAIHARAQEAIDAMKDVDA